MTYAEARGTLTDMMSSAPVDHAQARYWGRIKKRVLLVLALVIVVAAGLSAFALAGHGSGHGSPSFQRSVPTLRGAVAVGRLVAVNSRTNVAEFRISCGWLAQPGASSGSRALIPTRKLHPGLFRVFLRRATFNVETYPAGPASGIANAVTLKAWERTVRVGWTGSLYVPSGAAGPFLSNGPTTDICHGVLS